MRNGRLIAGAGLVGLAGIEFRLARAGHEEEIAKIPPAGAAEVRHAEAVEHRISMIVAAELLPVRIGPRLNHAERRRRAGIRIALTLRSDQRPDVIGQWRRLSIRPFTEMLDEERFDQPQVLRAGEARPAVAVPLDNLQLGLDAGLLQGVGQQFALPQRHEVVLVAVHDEEGSGVFIDVSQRAGPAGFLLVLLRRAADQQGHRRTGRVTFLAHRRQFRRPEPIQDALHAARLVEIAAAALKLLHAGRGAEQGDQMAAGQRAPNADVVGIEMILGGVRP